MTFTLISWIGAFGTAGLMTALAFVRPTAHKFRGSHHETAIYEGSR